jgi:hypothetical protein
LELNSHEPGHQLEVTKLIFSSKCFNSFIDILNTQSRGGQTLDFDSRISTPILPFKMVEKTKRVNSAHVKSSAQKKDKVEENNLSSLHESIQLVF